MNNACKLGRAAGLAALAWAAISGAAAHGLVQDPPSRNWYCGAVTKPDQVRWGTPQYPQCGKAFDSHPDPNAGYHFMSVLTHARGRAAVTPLPANVCGFNSESFKNGPTPWDAAMDWPTTKISAGPRKFSWNISWGPHFSDTEEFRYWITKPGFAFSATRPLAWSDFEDQPFCVQKYDDKNPTANPAVVADKAATMFHTTCTVPARSGRHVIYAEWGRNQWTLERFHGCIDVAFDGTGSGGGGSTTPAPQAVMSLSPAGSEFVGAGNLVLDAGRSSGTVLSYQWSVTPASSASHRLEDANRPQARLVLLEPAAQQSLQIGLMVHDAIGRSSTASTTLTHKPSIVAAWADLGPLTSTARTLQAGDLLAVRAVLTNGQDQYSPMPALKLASGSTAASAWPLALAQAVNAANGSLRVGVLAADGQTIAPVADATRNRVYARNGANVKSAFLVVTAPAAVVTASYAVNSDWATGYCATITVRNNGSSTVSPWRTSMKIAGRINGAWNIDWTQSGDTLSFSGPSWGNTLAPGGSFSNAGFCAAK